MIETHPYGSFVPPNSRYVLIGSFTGKPAPGYDWYYGTKRSQFWPIMEKVYGRKLKTKTAKENLFSQLKLAVTDMIFQCERRKGTNADNNLVNVVYNTPVIETILRQNPLEKIYFSGCFAETLFHRLFKNIAIEQITLPSPSPRYAAINLVQKIVRYQQLLPSL